MRPDQPSTRDRQWYIVGRWQEYEGERRANLLRIIGIGSFYIVHLMHYHGLRIGVLQLADEGDLSRQFHVQVTLLAVIWTMLALGMLLCLQQRIFPRWLKLFSTGSDLVLTDLDGNLLLRLTNDGFENTDQAVSPLESRDLKVAQF